MKSSKRGTSPKYFVGLAVSLVFLFTVLNQAGYKIRVVEGENVLGTSSNRKTSITKTIDAARLIIQGPGGFKSKAGSPRPPIKPVAPAKSKAAPQKSDDCNEIRVKGTAVKCSAKCKCHTGLTCISGYCRATGNGWAAPTPLP